MKSRRHRSPRADGTKCVRLLNRIVRVRNEMARRIVERDRDGEYCSKSAYKEISKSPRKLSREVKRIREIPPFPMKRIPGGFTHNTPWAEGDADAICDWVGG